MSTWILQPRDPLLTRDGRPFGADPGSRARSLPVPPPSVLAGAFRSRLGPDADGQYAHTLARGLRGPFLVELDDQGDIRRYGLPAPADARLFGERNPERIDPLLPAEPQAGIVTDLDGLLPVATAPGAPEKPSPVAPAFWSWDGCLAWLRKPVRGNWSSAWTFEGPAAEGRTHVSIASERLTASEGALFGTEGRRYAAGRGAAARSLALAFAPDDEAGLSDGWGTLGGERRLARWAKVSTPLPELPGDLLEAMVRQQACRVLLLTPAVFAGGFRPTWLLGERGGVKPALVAAAVRRPDTVSGWNLATRQPKPTRRLAPAGSVYFVSLEGDEAAIRAWLQALWWRAVSDDEQDRRDGFGVAALGVWNRAGQAGGAK